MASLPCRKQITNYTHRVEGRVIIMLLLLSSGYQDKIRDMFNIELTRSPIHIDEGDKMSNPLPSCLSTLLNGSQWVCLLDCGLIYRK